MKYVVSCIVAVILLCGAGKAKADMVTVNFSGTIGIITDTFGDLAATGIQSGVTTFSGSAVYDTTTTPWYTAPTFAQYWSNAYTVNIGSGFSWSSITSGNGIVVLDNSIVGSSTYYDMFLASETGYASFNGKNILMDSLVWMKDNSLLSLTSTDLPTADVLNNFNIDETFFRISGYTDTGERAWDLAALGSRVDFNVSTAVPEPSTLLLLGSGMVGLGMTRLRKFRKNA